jgi:hypothetical protein
MRIGQRIWSRDLFYAEHEEETPLRNSTFEILRRYLHSSLRQIRFAPVLQDFANASEKILHQTRKVLQRELLRREQTDQMILQLRRLVPQRDLVEVADTSDAVLDRLSRAAGLSSPVTAITRLRLDAALYDPAPGRQPGTHGHPR